MAVALADELTEVVAEVRVCVVDVGTGLFKSVSFR